MITLLYNTTKFIECKSDQFRIQGPDRRTLDSVPSEGGHNYALTHPTACPRGSKRYRCICCAHDRTQRNTGLLCTRRTLDHRTVPVLLLFSDDTTLKPNQRVTAIERCVLYTESIFLQTSVVLEAPLIAVVVTDSESALVVTTDLLLTPHFVANHHVALGGIALHDAHSVSCLVRDWQQI